MKKAKMEKCIWRQTPLDITVSFIREFSHISILDLEEILEYLEENNLLNSEGEDFREEFWKRFIKNSS
jgi:hypothetical protein